jgi:hypothetical protein
VIAPSEWKFFEGTEQRIKHLERHRLENEAALYTGESLPWDPSELATRQAAIVQEMEYAPRVEAALAAGPTPEQARHLELHRRWITHALFESHPDLFDLFMTLREQLVAFEPEVGGRVVSRADLDRILGLEADRGLREAAWRALAPLGESLQKELVELLQRREALARAVASVGFPDLALYWQELERAEALGWVDVFERTTRKVFEEAKAEIARTLGLHEIEPWDLDYGLTCLGELAESAFPPDQALAGARRQAERWGLDAGAVRIADGDPPNGLLVLPVDIPNAVQMIAARGHGVERWRTLYHGMGRALHHAHATGRRHFLETDSAPMLSGSGAVFEGALARAEAVHEITGAPPPAVKHHLNARRLKAVFRLREAVAATMFENLVYAESNLDPHRLYNDVAEQMLQTTRKPEPRWAADWKLLCRPLSRAGEIVGALLGAQTWKALDEAFENPLRDAGVGAWLRERYFEPGGGAAWASKVERATGAPLGVHALAEALGGSFAADSLETQDEISDEAVAEYFKDIDLSDIEE